MARVGPAASVQSTGVLGVQSNIGGSAGIGDVRRDDYSILATGLSADFAVGYTADPTQQQGGLSLSGTIGNELHVRLGAVPTRFSLRHQLRYTNFTGVFEGQYTIMFGSAFYQRLFRDNPVGWDVGFEPIVGVSLASFGGSFPLSAFFGFGVTFDYYVSSSPRYY